MFLILLALCLSACGGSHESPPDDLSLDVDRCVESFDPQRDYFPDKVSFRFAEQVEVEYHSHFKVVTLNQLWHGGGDKVRYLLLLCGTPRPEGWEEAAVIEIPARTVITTSTTELPHITGLGLVDRLLGHDELDWVSSPEIRRRIEAGELIEVGGGPSLNVELVVEADPDLLLSDSLGDPALDVLGKLREAEVPVALAPSFLETSPLGRAEWIKYTALFFNRERRAQELFGAVSEAYAELTAKVREAISDRSVSPLPPRRAGNTGLERPTVVTGGPIGDSWWMPGGRSYLALLLADAGADYLWAGEPSTGSLALDLETVYERAVEADYWLQPGGWGSLAEIRAVDQRLADFAAFRNGRVFNYDAKLNDLGGNEYWESGTARPDLVLADFVKILYPDLLPDHELVYHRRLD